MRIHDGPPSMHNHTGRSTLDLPCRALNAAMTQERFQVDFPVERKPPGFLLGSHKGGPPGITPL